MEWVETTGRTLEEAKDAALDELGVDERDAEFDVLEEPRRGLFGLLGSEARVRARVRPTAPRAKDDRRRRRGRDRARSGRANGDRGGEPAAATQEEPPAPTGGDGDGGSSDMDDLSVAEQGELARRFVAGMVEAFGLAAAVSVAELDEEAVHLVDQDLMSAIQRFFDQKDGFPGGE